uniref:Uncharacterized protein n=1 Tax=Siphoviridae sp. ct6YY1 TaxID=2825343 RepID=A0A8S5V2X7_9CAUD|nr:MAG TPA: hypothetical protein [Siphoviridae sp. ct6YY1]
MLITHSARPTSKREESNSDCCNSSSVIRPSNSTPLHQLSRRTSGGRSLITSKLSHRLSTSQLQNTLRVKNLRTRKSIHNSTVSENIRVIILQVTQSETILRNGGSKRRTTRNGGGLGNQRNTLSIQSISSSRVDGVIHNDLEAIQVAEGSLTQRILSASLIDLTQLVVIQECGLPRGTYHEDAARVGNTTLTKHLRRGTHSTQSFTLIRRLQRLSRNALNAGTKSTELLTRVTELLAGLRSNLLRGAITVRRLSREHSAIVSNDGTLRGAISGRQAILNTRQGANNHIVDVVGHRLSHRSNNLLLQVLQGEGVEIIRQLHRIVNLVGQLNAGVVLVQVRVLNASLRAAHIAGVDAGRVDVDRRREVHGHAASSLLNTSQRLRETTSQSGLVADSGQSRTSGLLRRVETVVRCSH